MVTSQSNNTLAEAVFDMFDKCMVYASPSMSQYGGGLELSGVTRHLNEHWFTFMVNKEVL